MSLSRRRAAEETPTLGSVDHGFQNVPNGYFANRR